MEVEIGKIETITRDVKDEQGDKASIRFVKLSVYVMADAFPDVISYDGATMHLYRNQAEANEGEVVIAADLKEQLKTLFKSGYDVLDSI